MATSPRKRVTKNYGLAALVNAVLAVIIYLMGDALATRYLGFRIAGVAIGFLSAALSLSYFGLAGFRKVPIASRAVPLILATRREDYELNEGWVWNWPAPIGDIETVNVTEQTLDVPLSEVLTDDNIPVTINLSAQYRVVNCYRFLSVNNASGSMREAIDSITRTIVQTLKAEQVGQEKKNIPNQIMNGDTALEALEIKGIAQYAMEQWGIEVIKIRITHVRLPEEMERANTEIQVQKAQIEREKQQAINETVEAEHVAKLIKLYRETGLSPIEAANMAQAERGKAKRIIIDGSGSPLEKAGALAGGVLNNQPPAASEPKPDHQSLNKQRRRQGKE